LIAEEKSKPVEERIEFPKISAQGLKYGNNNYDEIVLSPIL
jgi:hypothetical protein